MDDSSDRRLILKNEREKLIDYYVIDFNADQSVTPTNGLSNDLNWVNYASVLGQYSSSTFKT